MRNLQRASLIGLGFVLTFLPVAPRAMACDECNAILTRGLFDEYHYSSEAQFNLDLRTLLSMSKEEHQERQQNTSIGASLPIDGLLVGVNAKLDEAAKNSLLEQFRYDQDLKSWSKQKVEVYKRLANPQIVDRWAAVVIARHGTEILSIEIKGNVNAPDGELLATIAYSPRNAYYADRLKLPPLIVTGAEVIHQGTGSADGYLTAFSGTTTTLRRSGRQPVSMVINFDGYPSVKADLPKLQDPEPPPPPPSQIPNRQAWLEARLNGKEFHYRGRSGRTSFETDGRSTGSRYRWLSEVHAEVEIDLQWDYYRHERRDVLPDIRERRRGDRGVLVISVNFTNPAAATTGEVKRVGIEPGDPNHDSARTAFIGAANDLLKLIR